ncbi:MAG: hypothetical protein BGO29_12130 [Bacteroidales bacterium 36-12]|nr:MAG: hypothetical protein BGO29_12130 [Bacteroidales bacterium 36-12]
MFCKDNIFSPNIINEVFFEKFHIFLEAKMLVMRYDIIFSEIFSVFYLQVTEKVSTFAPALREKHG